MKKRLMVDQDDVICTGGFLYLMNEFLGTNYTYDDFDEYYMQNKIPKECKKEFFEWFQTQNLYDHCELLPGCYDVMEELNQEYDLYIGTSYIWTNIVSDSGFILKQKYDYLQKVLPFIRPYKYIFLSDKNVLNMDIKLDDVLTNLIGADTKLLFSAYHNKNHSIPLLNGMGVERMNNWDDVKRRLLKK